MSTTFTVKGTWSRSSQGEVSSFWTAGRRIEDGLNIPAALKLAAPSAKLLIECGRSGKHVSHVTDVRDVPVGDVLTE